MELVATTPADHVGAYRQALATIENDYVRLRADRDRLGAQGVDVAGFNEKLDALDKQHALLVEAVRQADPADEGPAAFRADDQS